MNWSWAFWSISSLQITTGLLGSNSIHSRTLLAKPFLKKIQPEASQSDCTTRHVCVLFPCVPAAQPGGREWGKGVTVTEWKAELA